MSNNPSIKAMLAKLLDVRTSNIIVGSVSQTTPLQIHADNDPNLLITDGNCFVPQGLTDYTVSIEIPSVGTKNCTIKGSLKRGDSVYMLSVERGALYFLLDKVGE